MGLRPYLAEVNYQTVLKQFDESSRMTFPYLAGMQVAKGDDLHETFVEKFQFCIFYSIHDESSDSRVISDKWEKATRWEINEDDQIDGFEKQNEKWKLNRILIKNYDVTTFIDVNIDSLDKEAYQLYVLLAKRGANRKSRSQTESEESELDKPTWYTPQEKAIPEYEGFCVFYTGMLLNINRICLLI